ncbi:hypothetical protein ASPWEDRAFT_37901 [Aspergillus wentii DTO 134E9]|uniref:Saponin hydrolase n=1 Tax=Aspergillus wentii DTO 134E9 TaxID=1073089 RepID=A0A1L9RN23_ASPWE|nr:uncharacterized protein ASPWEDRAFT_37901 [Aspergillus wentii DTO 134E9]KAI9925996.1 hypothetical protein MW887_004455 [Aspergillus wentii]OJJ36331.1 hypothetical protein ASPWEDRAFT_37901 [Aspergillus wentii DTO 134E9]
MRLSTINIAFLALSLQVHADTSPPSPEPIQVTELPLPPVVPTDAPGSCSSKINPHHTGCIGKTSVIQGGSFLPDGNHVTVAVNFTGAPPSPSPGSIYTGTQLILVRTNGTTFSNGDAWKCITCGIPAGNRNGSKEIKDYPQTFHDGKRLLAGYNIIQSNADLASDECTPNNTFIYPIRWNNRPDGSGSGGTIRELRLHPDNVHIGFNSFGQSNGVLDQFGYFARLEFNPSPERGSPRVPRYDLVEVTRLFDPNATQFLSVDGDRLVINKSAVTVGEFRGFTGRGDEVTYVGNSWESSNIDLFAAHLTTGKVRRLTSHPGYADPIDVSPDGKWNVILDTRSNNRTMFMAGMRHIPAITDLVSTTIAATIRNNGPRRFFQPWLLDRDGDRGSYYGQQINAAGDGSPGSANDPEWNAMADPRWSPDGTKIVYFQALTVPPACGGRNPLPCPKSTAPGGRVYRLMLATLTSRNPVHPEPVKPVSDIVPWGVPYEAGSEAAARPYPPAGNYTLHGQSSGSAHVTLANDPTASFINSVAVSYTNFSDDGLNFISGNEKVTMTPLSVTLQQVDWYSNLTSTGKSNSTKKTSPDGFHIRMDSMTNIFNANGTLTTTVDGVVYEQPANGT